MSEGHHVGAPKDYDTITYEVTGHTATITLNRPQALNALSPHMITELRAAYDEAEGEPVGPAHADHELETPEEAHEAQHTPVPSATTG